MSASTAKRWGEPRQRLRNGVRNGKPSTRDRQQRWEQAITPGEGNMKKKSPIPLEEESSVGFLVEGEGIN